MDLTPNIIKPWIDLVVVYGGTLVIFTALLYFGIKWTAFYFNSMMDKTRRENVEKIRTIHDEIDKEENEKSLSQMRNVQKYLDDRSEELFELGLDRVNVWVNHNGTRSGKFHFIFYSLVAEVVNEGTKSFGYSKIQPSRLPYYIFADYEMEIANHGFVFKQDSELKGTPLAIARDFGTKTVYGLPINSINGAKISGIIFFSSVRKNIELIPSVDHIANDVRALLI